MGTLLYTGVRNSNAIPKALWTLKRVHMTLPNSDTEHLLFSINPKEKTSMIETSSLPEHTVPEMEKESLGNKAIFAVRVYMCLFLLWR